MGPTISPLPPTFMEHFKKLGIAVEIMNTVSATNITFLAIVSIDPIGSNVLNQSYVTNSFTQHHIIVKL